VEYWLFSSDNVLPLSHNTLADGGDTGPISLPNIAVNRNTMLYLTVGANGEASADLTGVNFTVTQVPEPSTTSALVSSLLGLLAYAWRRK
jgi:hypothetical protein